MYVRPPDAADDLRDAPSRIPGAHRSHVLEFLDHPTLVSYRPSNVCAIMGSESKEGGVCAKDLTVAGRCAPTGAM